MILECSRRCIEEEKQYVTVCNTVVHYDVFSLFQGLRNLVNFSEEVLEVYKYTFSQKGALTPTINYHRNMFDSMGVQLGMVQVPTLLIWVRIKEIVTVTIC